MSSNIKRVRAEVGFDDINTYMDNLGETLKDIPPSRIWNYDETNLSDNPGNKKVISKRGAKYVEKICNFSKSSTSVMFCGNAEGKLLAPYVVYKAENMWTTWTENGPENTRYNRSKSGWFDSITFEDWFTSHFLKEIKCSKDSPTVLIGDNLASHINIKVLQLCDQHNIRFVCLPPNTTHLTQPLDVAFFAPMIKVWRNILTKWKESKSGSKYSTIPKDLFPTLLNELINNIKANAGQNLVSGFNKCGIFPFNKQTLLDRLPQNEVNNEFVGSAFIEQLDAKRQDYLGTSGTKKNRKKLNVPSGKSINVSDVKKPQEISLQTEPQKNKRKRRVSESSSSSGDNDLVLLESDEDSEVFSDSEQEEPYKLGIINQEKLSPEDVAVDNFVLVLYNKEKYPGKVHSISKEGVMVDCMEKRLTCWRWPQRQDISLYDWKDILTKINSPKMISRRNQFSVPELNSFI